MVIGIGIGIVIVLIIAKILIMDGAVGGSVNAFDDAGMPEPSKDDRPAQMVYDKNGKRVR